MPSQYKTYTRSSAKLPYRVKTWINRRCKVCHKFIGGQKQFLCNKCYRKRHNDRYVRKEVYYYGLQSIREALDNLSIPDYLRNSLRCYL